MNFDKLIVIGWYAFFGVFLGTDFIVWMLRIFKRSPIPTFSRAVCGTLPWWVVLPLTLVLFVHFLLIYLGDL